MSNVKKGDSGRVPVTSAPEVRHFTGPIDDSTVMAILNMNPTVEELETAALHARGQVGRPEDSASELSGTTALIFDALMQDDIYRTEEL